MCHVANRVQTLNSSLDPHSFDSRAELALNRNPGGGLVRWLVWCRWGGIDGRWCGVGWGGWESGRNRGLFPFSWCPRHGEDCEADSYRDRGMPGLAPRAVRNQPQREQDRDNGNCDASREPEVRFGGGSASAEDDQSCASAGVRS